MKIDVEGFERNVLDGYDWAVRPDLIVLEFEDSKTVPLGYSWKDLADGLIDRGYQVLVSEWFPIERYGGSHRGGDLRATRPSSRTLEPGATSSRPTTSIA